MQKTTQNGALVSSSVSAAVATIDVVVADDHVMVREGLRRVLEREPDLRVVGEAGDVSETERALAAHRPAVLLLELLMGHESSLPRLAALRRASPSTAIVVLTMEMNALVASDAIRRGAAGYVPKNANSTELVDAIRCAATGGTYLDPQLGARLAIEHAAESDVLGERDIEILRLLALGHTSAEIAARLYLSVRTVETRRRELQNRLGLTTRAEVVQYVRERRLSG